MTISQARTGDGPRAQNLPDRLHAIRAPRNTADDYAAAMAYLRRTGNEDVADMLGLTQREGA